MYIFLKILGSTLMLAGGLFFIYEFYMILRLKSIIKTLIRIDIYNPNYILNAQKKFWVWPVEKAFGKD